MTWRRYYDRRGQPCLSYMTVFGENVVGGIIAGRGSKKGIYPIRTK